MENGTALENNCGQMALYMKDSGNKEWLMGLAGSFILTVTLMREIGFKTKQTVLEGIFTRMVHFTKENGKMTCKRATEKKFGLMDQFMKVTTNRDRRMGKAGFNGQTDLFFLEILLGTPSMGKDHILGLMDENIKENGKTTKCMVLESLFGLMAKNILAIM